MSRVIIHNKSSLDDKTAVSRALEVFEGGLMEQDCISVVCSDCVIQCFNVDESETTFYVLDR